MPAALELDRVRQPSFMNRVAVAQRLLGAGLVGAERQVGDDQRVLRAARVTARTSGSSSSTVTGTVVS